MKNLFTKGLIALLLSAAGLLPLDAEAVEGGAVNRYSIARDMEGAVLLAAADKNMVAGAWDMERGKGPSFDEFEDEFGVEEVKEVFDPLSGYNRLMTGFNDKAYFWLVKPVARGYRYVVPEPARLSVNRFFNNLFFPVSFVNNILQLKFKRAGVELSRFCVNSTVGILGLADPAKEWLDLEPYPEDFGQTLGFYGVGGGFHIVLPLLGPSNVRDLVSMVPDYLVNPVQVVETDLDELALRSYDVVNMTSLHIGEYESLRGDAIDLYTFLRDIYEQNRNKKIED